MLDKIGAVLISARPLQWFKNLSLFAAITFSGQLFDKHTLFTVSTAFAIFCGLSSATYIINDIVDAPKDRLHPNKRKRPIAAGLLGTDTALLTAILLLIVLLPLSYLINKFFFVLAFSYILLQFSYSLLLRQVIILDALTVALGFIIRVYAGSLVVEAPISSWLVVATIGLSLLLAFGKRRSESTLLATHQLEAKTRNTLQHYPLTLLDAMISVSASITILSYVLFTFQISPTESILTISGWLPTTLLKPKWMMLSIPLVIYGVARYLYVIYEKREGESPAEVMVSDKPLLSTIIIWLGFTVTVLYLLGR